MKLFQWTASLIALGALASSILAQTEPKPDAAAPTAPPSSVAVVQDTETTPPPPALAPPLAPTAPPPPLTAARRAFRERYGLPSPITPQRPPAPEANSAPATEAVTTGIFEEEADQNPEAAVRSYQAVINRFDSQRANVANAIFRLGECYRKLDRMEEAKVQYARILREFTDQAQLVQSSQKHLATPAPRPRAAGYSGGSGSIGAAGGGFGGGGGGGGDVIQPSGGGGGLNPGTGTLYRDRLSQIIGRANEDPLSQSAMLKRQLDQAQTERMNIESKALRNRALWNMVHNVSPANLPEKAAADPRYQELKKVYEKSVLAADSAAREKASQQLSTWVKEVYFPELDEAEKADQIELKFYATECEALAQKLKDQQQADEKRKQPAAGRF